MKVLALKRVPPGDRWVDVEDESKMMDNLTDALNHIFKKENNPVLVVGKTFGHLYQSVFFEEIYSINEGPPPEINLLNEKNNGETVLEIINKNLANPRSLIESIKFFKRNKSV